jgi:hypothetical protein
MPDWMLVLLIAVGFLAIMYRAFLHTPRAPPSGNDHEVGVTNYLDARGRFEPPEGDR